MAGCPPPSKIRQGGVKTRKQVSHLAANECDCRKEERRGILNSQQEEKVVSNSGPGSRHKSRHPKCPGMGGPGSSGTLTPLI